MSTRIRKRKGCKGKPERVAGLIELPVCLFKAVALIVVTGSFILYLVNLSDSTAYFTSRAESDSMTVTFAGGVQQQPDTGGAQDDSEHRE